MPKKLRILNFACPCCYTRLQAPISYAGHFGPCPNCGDVVLAPATKTLAVTPLPNSVKLSSESTRSCVMRDTPLALANQWEESFTVRQKNASALVSSRMILPDNALSHYELERKDNRNTVRMIQFVIFVILLISAVIWLLKSMGKQGFD